MTWLAEPENLLSVAIISATFLGPVFAVLITLWWTSFNNRKEQQRNLFFTLVTTRGRAHDPAYSSAIKAIPAHFSKSKKVMRAHRDYTNYAMQNFDEAPNEENFKEIVRLQNLLLDELASSLGLKNLNSGKIIDYQAGAHLNLEQLQYNALVAVTKIAGHLEKSVEISSKLLENSESVSSTPE